MTKSIKRPILVGAIAVIITAFGLSSSAQAAGTVLSPSDIASNFTGIMNATYGEGTVAGAADLAVACEAATELLCTVPLSGIGALVTAGTVAYLYFNPDVITQLLASSQKDILDPAIYRVSTPVSSNPGYIFSNQQLIPAGTPGSPANGNTIKFTITTPKPNIPIEFGIYELLNGCISMACADGPSTIFSSGDAPYTYIDPYGTNPKVIVQVLPKGLHDFCLDIATCNLIPVGQVGDLPAVVGPINTPTPTTPSDTTIPTPETKPSDAQIKYYWQNPDGSIGTITKQVPYDPTLPVKIDPSVYPPNTIPVGVGVDICTTGLNFTCTPIIAPPKTYTPYPLPSAIPQSPTSPAVPVPNPPKATTPSDPTQTHLCNGVSYSSSVACPLVPPSNDSCGFNILAPTSWVSCLFIPTPGAIKGLFETFNNTLSGSAVGQIKDLTLQLISPITSGWNTGDDGCIGVPIDFDYVIASGAAIHFHEHPFSTCEPGFVRTMAQDWALPLQSFVVVFGTFVIVTNMILRALSIGDSMWQFTPGGSELDWLFTSRSGGGTLTGGSSRDGIGGGSSRRSLGGSRIRRAISGRRNRKAINGSPKRKELN